MTPPISACEELDGTANHHVTRFHMTAPASAAIKIRSSTKLASFTISAPMVFATPVEYIAPKKFKQAAIIIAWLG